MATARGRESSEKDPLAKAAFVFALLGFVCLIAGVGVFLAIAGIVLGHVALSRARRTACPENGRAFIRAALGLGYLTLFLFAVLASLFAAFVLPAALKQRPSPEQRNAIASIGKMGPDEAYLFILKTLDHSQADAELNLKAAVSRHPDSQKLALFQAVCSRSRWSKSRASSQLSGVVDMNPHSTEGKCAQCVLAIDNGTDVEKNFDLLRDLLKKNPEDPLLLWTMGIECREYTRRTSRRTYSEEGADAYKRLLARFEVGPVLLHQTYANILSEELNRHEEALEHRRIAVRLEPAGWSYEGLGNTLVKLQRYEEAFDAFTRTVAFDPDDAHGYLCWGLGLQAAAKYEEAMEKFKRATELNPSEGRAWYEWGLCLHSLGRDPEALRQLQQAEKNGYVRATAMIGDLYENGRGVGKDPAAAAQYYQRAAERGNGWAMNRLGDACRDGAGVQRSNTQAVQWYLRGAEAGNGEAAYNAGMMFLNGEGVHRDEKRAFALLDRAAHCATPSVEAAIQLSLCYRRGMGCETNMAKSIEYSIMSADMGAENTALFAGYAYEEGKYVPRDSAKALRYYEAASACNIHTAKARILAARIMAVSPDPQYWNGPKAVELATSALKVAGSDVYYYLDTLAAAYARNGQFKEAVETEQKAVASMNEFRKIRNPWMDRELDRWQPGFEAKIKLYESGQAYADSPPETAGDKRSPNPFSKGFRGE